MITCTDTHLQCCQYFIWEISTDYDDNSDDDEDDDKTYQTQRLADAKSATILTYTRFAKFFPTFCEMYRLVTSLSAPRQTQYNWRLSLLYRLYL
jgi:hypothetical protein